MLDLVVVLVTHLFIAAVVTSFAFISLESQAAKVLFERTEPELEQTLENLDASEEIRFDFFRQRSRYRRAVLAFFGWMFGAAVLVHVVTLVLYAVLYDGTGAAPLVFVFLLIIDWLAARAVGIRRLEIGRQSNSLQGKEVS
jgi:hypothetical protein